MLKMNLEYQLSSLSLKVRPFNWALMRKAIITLWQKATSTKRQLEVKPSFMSRANFILIIKLILPRIMKRHITSYNEIYLTLLIFIIWFCHILCWWIKHCVTLGSLWHRTKFGHEILFPIYVELVIQLSFQPKYWLKNIFTIISIFVKISISVTT